jgi:hypothetical protein
MIEAYDFSPPHHVAKSSRSGMAENLRLGYIASYFDRVGILAARAVTSVKRSMPANVPSNDRILGMVQNYQNHLYICCVLLADIFQRSLWEARLICANRNYRNANMNPSQMNHAEYCNGQEDAGREIGRR